jgi:hypothetical protein
MHGEPYATEFIGKARHFEVWEGWKQEPEGPVSSLQ